MIGKVKILYLSRIIWVQSLKQYKLLAQVPNIKIGGDKARPWNKVEDTPKNEQDVSITFFKTQALIIIMLNIIKRLQDKVNQDINSTQTIQSDDEIRCLCSEEESKEKCSRISKFTMFLSKYDFIILS